MALFVIFWRNIAVLDLHITVYQMRPFLVTIFYIDYIRVHPNRQIKYLDKEFCHEAYNASYNTPSPPFPMFSKLSQWWAWTDIGGESTVGLKRYPQTGCLKRSLHFLMILKPMQELWSELIRLHLAQEGLTSQAPCDARLVDVNSHFEQIRRHITGYRISLVIFICW